MRVAFAGTPEFALPALAALLEFHEVAGVLTQPDRPSGRGRKLRASPVKELAEQHRLPVFQPASLRDAAAQAQLSAWNPQLLVVVAYGLILPPAVLALPPLGCLNIHASLLPRWRGAAPIQRAILAGDAVTGVSIMRMDQGLDTGPTLLERRHPIGTHDTAGSLEETLARLGAEALLEVLAGLESGSVQASPQPVAGVTYAAKIDKPEALIDWSRPAADIDRQVRAFNPRPIAYTLLDGERVRIYSASIVPQKASKGVEAGSIISLNDGNLLVQCGAGSILAVSRLQMAGGTVLPVSPELVGNLNLPGRRFG